MKKVKFNSPIKPEDLMITDIVSIDTILKNTKFHWLSSISNIEDLPTNPNHGDVLYVLTHNTNFYYDSDSCYWSSICGTYTPIKNETQWLIKHTEHGKLLYE